MGRAKSEQMTGERPDTTRNKPDTSSTPTPERKFERAMAKLTFEQAQRDQVQKQYGKAIKMIDSMKDAPMMGRETVKGMTFIKRQAEMAKLKPAGYAHRAKPDTVPDKPIIPKAKENAERRKKGG